eukprot:Pgem_evm1s10266
MFARVFPTTSKLFTVVNTIYTLNILPISKYNQTVRRWSADFISEIKERAVADSSTFVTGEDKVGVLNSFRQDLLTETSSSPSLAKNFFLKCISIVSLTELWDQIQNQ